MKLNTNLVLHCTIFVASVLILMMGVNLIAQSVSRVDLSGRVVHRGVITDSPQIICDPDGLCSMDCDDSNPHVYPGATEICDGLDNNCDGRVDEGCSTPQLAPKIGWDDVVRGFIDFLNILVT